MKDGSILGRHLQSVLAQHTCKTRAKKEDLMVRLSELGIHFYLNTNTITQVVTLPVHLANQ